MNSQMLNSLIAQDEQLKNICLGVFAADKIPRYLGEKACFIANTHKSTMVGEHWVALFRNGLFGEYFDSFGLAPKKWSTRFIGEYSYFNNICLQGSDSQVCAYYCLYYLYHKARGHRLEEIVKALRTSERGSDRAVYDFIEQRFNKSG